MIESFVAEMADAYSCNDFRRWNETRAVFADYLEETEHPWAGMARTHAWKAHGRFGGVSYFFLLPPGKRILTATVANGRPLFNWKTGELQCVGSGYRMSGRNRMGVQRQFLEFRVVIPEGKDLLTDAELHRHGFPGLWHEPCYVKTRL